MTTDDTLTCAISPRRWARQVAALCPVAPRVLGKQKPVGEMPYCPVHRIRIHAGTRTFVYYNGPDEVSKRNAACEISYSNAAISESTFWVTQLKPNTSDLPRNQWKML